MALDETNRTPIAGALRGAVLALGLCGGCGEPDAAPRARSSVVLIVVDTLRADLAEPVVGDLRTPTIDALAESGVSYPRAFTHAPMTLPAHTALFSARPPHATGVLNNGQVVPEDLPLLAQHLQAHGYTTHAVISMTSVHRLDSPHPGLARGFDRFESAASAFIASGGEVNAALGPVLDRIDPDQPFFLFAHFSDPHEPYNAHLEVPKSATIRIDGGAPESVTTSNLSVWKRELEVGPEPLTLTIEAPQRFRLRTVRAWGPADAAASSDVNGGRGDRLEPRFVEGALKAAQKRAVVVLDPPAAGPGTCTVELVLSDHPVRKRVPQRYGREIEYVDEQLAQLLAELTSRGLLEDTVLVFTSDHGEALADRTGFIGHVRTLFDELVHVPLVIVPARPADADRLRPGATAIVGHLDVVPTLLDLLDLPPLPGQVGHSLLAPPRERAPVVSETRRPEAQENLASLRDEHYKLVYHADDDRFELFDLAADPGERTDVFEERGQERAEWQARLRRIASAAAAWEARAQGGELTPEAIEDLQALGYLGEE